MKSNSRVYVIGHKNPDTDSICSAIAYADIKNRTDKTKTYMARRAGQINEETEYVLKRFGVRAPGYLPNAGTQVKEIEIHEVPSVPGTISVKKAYSMMKNNNVVTHLNQAGNSFDIHAVFCHGKSSFLCLFPIIECKKPLTLQTIPLQVRDSSLFMCV